MDFARLGWCERGRSCTARHTFDCADFLEKGSCERKGCRLQHNVVAREKMSTGAGRGGATGEHLAAAAQGGVGPVPAMTVEGDEGTGEADVPPLSSGFISANHGASKGSKRKRAGRAGEVVGLVEPQEEEEGISFVGGGKRKKAFQQKDFISFDDDDDEEEEEENEREDEGFERGDHAEGQGEVSEVDSVSSGEDDEESTDEGSESDEGDDDEDEQSDNDDSSSEGSSE